MPKRRRFVLLIEPETRFRLDQRGADMVAGNHDLASITLTFERTGVVRVSVAGEIDLSNAHLLGESALWAVSVPHVTSMQVDLSEMTFLDAVGVSTMVSLA